MTDRKRLLFVSRYKQRRGGHITLRDYFRLAVEHPDLDPYVFFTPGADRDNDVWADVPRDRFVDDLDPWAFDALVVTGRIWHVLPKDLRGVAVISLILHVRHAESELYRPFLSRPAIRIANTQQVAEAVRPLANGPVEVLHESVDFTLFHREDAKVPGSVLIYGQKNRALCRVLTDALRADGVPVTSFTESVPQAEFARHMREAEVFVALPNRTEGGYRPPLEAMASGTALVCSDTIGARDYVRPDETCLQPAYSDRAGHLDAVRRLLADADLRTRLVDEGVRTVADYTRRHQQERFAEIVEQHVLPLPPSRRPRPSLLARARHAIRRRLPARYRHLLRRPRR